MTLGDGGTTTSVTRFLEGNEVGAECEFDGQRAFVSWEDLRLHASFPAEATTITEEAVTTDLGTFDCLRYDVVRGERVDRFWFAKDLPGMPIVSETVVGDRTVSRSTVVGNDVG